MWSRNGTEDLRWIPETQIKNDRLHCFSEGLTRKVEARILRWRGCILKGFTTVLRIKGDRPFIVAYKRIQENDVLGIWIYVKAYYMVTR